MSLKQQQPHKKATPTQQRPMIIKATRMYQKEKDPPSFAAQGIVDNRISVSMLF